MLDDFHGEDDVEGRALSGESLRRGGAVIDIKTISGGMPARHLDRRGCRIDPGDGCAEAGERLGEQSAAAADVEKRETLEGPWLPPVAAELGRNLIPDPVETTRIERMQRRRLARWIPPGFGHRCEFPDFAGVDRLAVVV